MRITCNYNMTAGSRQEKLDVNVDLSVDELYSIMNNGDKVIHLSEKEVEVFKGLIGKAKRVINEVGTESSCRSRD